MYKWLEDELSSVKTPGFHMVDGLLNAELREAVLRSTLPLPHAYREFALRFGNARLYRESHNNSYKIGVFASPRETTTANGESIYSIGFHDGANVCIKPQTSHLEYAIFELEIDSEEKVADRFEEWLKSVCCFARNSYGQRKWAEILRGPNLFSSRELSIVRARRLIRWRVLGLDLSGDHVIEITNSSDCVLPVITIGVRSKDRRLNGVITPKIEHLAPGQKGFLHVDCYKEFLSPNEVELFSLPDPQPEDRERFRELDA